MKEVERKRSQEFSDILDQIGQELDITESQFDAAVKSYNAVGSWLCKEDSLLALYSPEILPQGSFMLGTMVRSINGNDDIDIDLVCQLKGKRLEWTQKDLKQIVGRRIREHETYKKMLDSEGRRCWTLIYSDDANYHMDILPSVGASDFKIILEKTFATQNFRNIDELSIRITDREKENYDNEININYWLKSNPFGYGRWFFERAAIEISEKRLLSASIKPVPNYQKNKLPLQRVVQLLKRHRDIMFDGDKNRPISIIITTLAAKSYNKERDVLMALQNIVNRLESHIEIKWSPDYNKYIKWVANPVNPEENFADKWPENQILEKSFYDWLEKLKGDIQNIEKKDITDKYLLLKGLFGQKIVNKVYKERGLKKGMIISDILTETRKVLIPKADHRQPPKWEMKLINTVEIVGRFKSDSKWYSIIETTQLPKNAEILFTAITDVSEPFEVYWQIVNTGEEAERQGDLRGEIFKSKTAGIGGLRQKEHSSYKGIHWVECFIVKEGVCVGRSEEFYITIS